MDTTDRRTLGRANRRKGHQAERDQARYLRHLWPDAKRKPDNAWRAPDGSHALDCGDIANTPGVVWQIKATPTLADGALTEAYHDAEDQAVAAGADYAIVVHRRPGKSNPGQWWAHLRLSDLLALAADQPIPAGHTALRPLVRVEQHTLLRLLARNGYGTSCLHEDTDDIHTYNGQMLGRRCADCGTSVEPPDITGAPGDE